MAQSAQIQTISHRHDLLLDFMIANPTFRLKELSAHFQMTVAWISTIINSDVFQLRLKERQDECFIATAQSLRCKMEGVAHQAVEKLGIDLENSQDGKFTLDVADKVLHRLGYAPSRSDAKASTVHNTQVNLYQTDAATLAKAREAMALQSQPVALALPEENVVPTTESDMVKSVPELVNGQTDTD